MRPTTASYIDHHVRWDPEDNHNRTCFACRKRHDEVMEAYATAGGNAPLAAMILDARRMLQQAETGVAWLRQPPKPKLPRGPLTLDEAARRLDLTPREVREMTEAGEIRSYQRLTIDASEIERVRRERKGRRV